MCFTVSRPYPTHIVYSPHSHPQANWEERLTTNQDRIYKVMGSAAFFDDSNKFLKLSDLIEAFETALPKTERMAQLNPRLAVAQGFVDTKHSKFRMELLVPIIIRFPKRNGNFYKFALAVCSTSTLSTNPCTLFHSLWTLIVFSLFRTL